MDTPVSAGLTKAAGHFIALCKMNKYKNSMLHYSVCAGNVTQDGK